MYFQENGTWTDKHEQAKSFPGIEMVLLAMHKYGLRDCELVLQMENSPSAAYDVVLPLGPGFR